MMINVGLCLLGWMSAIVAHRLFEHLPQLSGGHRPANWDSVRLLLLPVRWILLWYYILRPIAAAADAFARQRPLQA